VGLQHSIDIELEALEIIRIAILCGFGRILSNLAFPKTVGLASEESVMSPQASDEID
jgi:hypothetical protein